MKRLITLFSLLALTATANPWLNQKTQVTFAWDKYPDETIHIRIYASEQAGAYFSDLSFDAQPNTTEYTVFGLDPAKTWYFVATAISPTGAESFPTEEIRLDPAVPLTPVAFKIVEVKITTTLQPE